jgi:hypothetical protein
MKEKYRTCLADLEYALPFTEFEWSNDDKRNGGASRCFDYFSNILGLRRLIQQETYRHQTFSLVAFL